MIINIKYSESVIIIEDKPDSVGICNRYRLGLCQSESGRKIWDSFQETVICLWVWKEIPDDKIV